MSTETQTMSEVHILSTPIKSANDKKDYRLIKLPNGLKALLIRKVEESSVSEPLAAANLTVGVGSFDEPRSIGGLAHFLEHLLFLGSDKYPEETGYNDFISKNGGTNNAMTENEYTTYFFEVSEKAFTEALDRFSQQFVSPLLLKSMLQREREAVDSEYQMAQARDGIRVESFFKIFINDDHPASWFDYGNLRTLKDEVSDDELFLAVREFFTKKYIANNMYLSMQSCRSLDDMQQLALDCFSGVKSGDVPVRSKKTLEEIFKPEFYTKMYFVKPLQEAQYVYLTWNVESLDQHYKCHPLRYFSKVFGNAGEGGLATFLQEQKLALAVSINVDYQSFEANSMFALVKLRLRLTDFGVQNIDKILEAIFSYLLMIKETPIDEHRRLYNEKMEKSETDFRFQSESEATNNVMTGVIGMKYYDDEDILRGSSVFQEFDEKVITDVIHAINQRKFNLLIINDKHPTFDKKEKYFGTEYEEKDFPEEYQKLWDERKLNPEFFLEKPNPFKCTDFDIFVSEEESTKHPVKVLENEKYELWHKLDNKFKNPQASVRINVIAPTYMTSAFNSLILDLYERVLIFTLSKKVFPAVSAGLRISSDVTEKGFQITFSGYNQKLLLFSELVVKALRKLPDDCEEIFNVQKEQKKKTLSNSLLRASSLSSDFTSKLMETDFWTDLDYYNEIDKISFETMQKFIEKFYRKTKTQILVQGNILRSHATEVVNILENNLQTDALDRKYMPNKRAYQLPTGTNILRLKSLMPKDDNSVIANIYQVGPQTPRNLCLLRMIESILDPKAFDYLRTKEQLGYSVSLDVASYANILHLKLEVSSQEDKHSFPEVIEKMNFFMDVVARKAVEELTDDEFETTRDARVKMLTAEDLDLDDEVTRNWLEIKKLYYVFDRNELNAEHTKALMKVELQDFFKSFTASDNMRKLSVQVIGSKTTAENSDADVKDRELNIEYMTEKLHERENLINDIEEFQSRLFLHPVIRVVV